MSSSKNETETNMGGKMSYVDTSADYGNDNLRTGTEVILQQNYNRCQLMKDYHEIKCKLKNVLSVKKIMNIAFFRLRGDNIAKPTADYFFNKMVNSIKWGESSDGYGDADTEYYSACGYDDMILAQKENAKGVAIECWRAYKHLKNLNKKNYSNEQVSYEYKQLLIYLRLNHNLFHDLYL